VHTKLQPEPEKRSPHGRPRRRWEDNIVTCLREIAWEVVDWTYLANGCSALVETVSNLHKKAEFFD
jgi:hypothetical protein